MGKLRPELVNVRSADSSSSNDQRNQRPEGHSRSGRQLPTTTQAPSSLFAMGDHNTQREVAVRAAAEAVRERLNGGGGTQHSGRVPDLVSSSQHPSGLSILKVDSRMRDIGMEQPVCAGTTITRLPSSTPTLSDYDGSSCAGAGDWAMDDLLDTSDGDGNDDEDRIFQEKCEICGPYERHAKDAPHGEIQEDIRLCDNLLCLIKTKELNELLKAKSITKDRTTIIKERRRTLKNRGYASSSRDKKTSEDEELKRAIEVLQDECETEAAQISEYKQNHFKELSRELQRSELYRRNILKSSSEIEVFDEIYYEDFKMDDADML